ncbi:MAG: hypothetical protein LBT53_06080 [Puniceicoccales bacterium]|jgi:lipopolysaccharide export system protein LptA|nr:hypothetical protein [Puniceicoccales bacterium]
MFAEYNKATGNVERELRAAQAAPDGERASSGKKAKWKLSEVEIRLYQTDAATGKIAPTVVIETPDCAYDGQRAEARSPARLRMRGAGDNAFELSGKGWAWRDDEPHGEWHFAIHSDVAFRLAANERHGELNIFSERLDVTLQKGAGAPFHLFHFSGNVRLLVAEKPEVASAGAGAGVGAGASGSSKKKDTGVGEIQLNAETLTARLKNNAAPRGTQATGSDPADPFGALPLLGAKSAAKPTGTSAAGAKPAGKTSGTAKKQESELVASLENIEATGGVKTFLGRSGYTMAGKNGYFDGKTETFSVAGDAKMSDPARSLNVTGEKITHKKESGKIEVFGRLTSAEAGTTRQPVRLEIPSFVSRLGDDGKLKKLDAAQIAALPPAVVTGDYLLADISRPERSFVTVRQNVRVNDDKFTLSAESVIVESPRDPQNDLLLSSLSGDADKLLDRVRLIRAEGFVRANYDDYRLECGRADIFPKSEIFVLEGAPSLIKGGARLRGHRIELHHAKGIAQASSAPDRRAEITLPPIATPDPKLMAAAGRAEARNLETVVRCDTLTMTENKKTGTARLHLNGNVVFTGGLRGHCDRMDILADSPKKTTPSAGAKKTAAPPRKATTTENLSRITRMTATGHVSLSADDYTAEGGEAVVRPRVALAEKLTRDDSGLDGREPQFLVLRRHESTPGKRPRLTIRVDRERTATNLGAAFENDGAENKGGAKTTAPQTAPVFIESELLEIVRGEMRSRFFLHDDVTVNSPELGLSGRCDNVEGVIIREVLPAGSVASPPRPNAGSGAKKPAPAGAGAGAKKPAGAKTPKSDFPSYELAQIIGKGAVQMTVKGDKGTCERFDLFPLKDEIRLSGNPRLTRANLAEVGSGGDFIYNWKDSAWSTERATDPKGGVARPTIDFPLRGDNFRSQ